MERDEILARLTQAGRRMGVGLKVRPAGGAPGGMALSFLWSGVPIHRTCTGQGSQDANLQALLHWLVDLARNLERGIERIDEALRGDGVALVREGEVPAGSERRQMARLSHYRGSMSSAEAWEGILRAARRLGLDETAISLTRDGEAAVLRFRLGDGRLVEKRSALQAGLRQNSAALALWLRCRARHHELGIDRDLHRAMAAYLLPEVA
jgi:hypothetical protein